MLYSQARLRPTEDKLFTQRKKIGKEFFVCLFINIEALKIVGYFMKTLGRNGLTCNSLDKKFLSYWRVRKATQCV